MLDGGVVVPCLVLMFTTLYHCTRPMYGQSSKARLHLHVMALPSSLFFSSPTNSIKRHPHFPSSTKYSLIFNSLMLYRVLGIPPRKTQTKKVQTKQGILTQQPQGLTTFLSDEFLLFLLFLQIQPPASSNITTISKLIISRRLLDSTKFKIYKKTSRRTARAPPAVAAHPCQVKAQLGKLKLKQRLTLTIPPASKYSVLGRQSGI